MQHIDDILKGGSDVVTYRLLARQAKISVNSAKELLEEYSMSNQGRIHVSYLITGEIATSTGDADDEATTEIRVVPQELLEDAKANYSSFTIHIYSIENAPIKSNDVFANIDVEVNKVDSLDLMTKCRVLKNPSITYTARPLFSSSGHNVAVKPQPAAVQPQPSKPALQIQKQTSSVSATSSKGASSKSKPSKPNPTTKSGFFANQIKQDEERKQKAMVLEAGKQAEREKIKEKVRAEALKDAFVNQEVDAKLMGMFDEDDEVNPRKRGADSDDEGGSDQDDHETKRLRLMAKLSADPNASNEEEEEESMDGTQKPSEPTNELMEDDAVINGVTEPDIERITRRVRRRRKVIKKVTSQVGKYMKTVDVEGWESYSEEELVPVVKSVPKVPVMQQHDVVVDPMPVENKPVEAAASTKKTSPTKPKGKAATKKAAANHGQKLISSFFKK